MICTERMATHGPVTAIARATGDCAPAELEMQLAITHADQQRLDEEQRIPRRNGEAVDKIEAEDGRVDHPALTRRAAGHEMTEAHQHGHEEAGAAAL